MNNISLIFSVFFFAFFIVIESRLEESLCKCEPYHQFKSRIINGTKVGKDDFRFLVSLFVKS